ncbi:GNAT family N-acetyltransferase [Peribacillus huizhouensis]|uniref:GNAT superfamily N-acetyltransferase n=1 Tax=Peribacillus huizhouensis TaxID=1501239 RepID=A0ABR6CJ70_9BACI|nr:GNAT family N-acetyltransferase [Peribacillus huizhouensis]MBA9025114.1 GNAT superfamily N-acetyltransferase [Peribacillus huizhouensis]
MTEIIRLATLDDAERLLHVTLRAYKPIRKLDIKWPAATADIELVKKNITDFSCYVLEKDGIIIATVTVRTFAEVPDLTCVWWFAVDPNYKGFGYGKKILDWVEEVVIRDQLNQSAVGLGTSPRHPWLVSMYERRGYEQIFETNHGDGQIGVFMRKSLLAEYKDNKTEKQEDVRAAN